MSETRDGKALDVAAIRERAQRLLASDGPQLTILAGVLAAEDVPALLSALAEARQAYGDLALGEGARRMADQVARADAAVKERDAERSLRAALQGRLGGEVESSFAALEEKSRALEDALAGREFAEALAAFRLEELRQARTSERNALKSIPAWAGEERIALAARVAELERSRDPQMVAALLRVETAVTGRAAMGVDPEWLAKQVEERLAWVAELEGALATAWKDALARAARAMCWRCAKGEAVAWVEQRSSGWSHPGEDAPACAAGAIHSLHKPTGHHPAKAPPPADGPTDEELLGAAIASNPGTVRRGLRISAIGRTVAAPVDIGGDETPAAAPVKAPPAMLASLADVWRCSGCGEMLEDPPGPAWRWTGIRWEHRCPESDPRAGYEPASSFGPRDPLVKALAGGSAPAAAACGDCGHPVTWHGRFAGCVHPVGDGRVCQCSRGGSWSSPVKAPPPADAVVVLDQVGKALLRMVRVYEGEYDPPEGTGSWPRPLWLVDALALVEDWKKAQPPTDATAIRNAALEEVVELAEKKSDEELALAKAPNQRRDLCAERSLVLAVFADDVRDLKSGPLARGAPDVRDARIAALVDVASEAADDLDALQIGMESSDLRSVERRLRCAVASVASPRASERAQGEATLEGGRPDCDCWRTVEWPHLPGCPFRPAPLPAQPAEGATGRTCATCEHWRGAPGMIGACGASDAPPNEVAYQTDTCAGWSPKSGGQGEHPPRVTAADFAKLEEMARATAADMAADATLRADLALFAGEEHRPSTEFQARLAERRARFAREEHPTAEPTPQPAISISQFDSSPAAAPDPLCARVLFSGAVCGHRAGDHHPGCAKSRWDQGSDADHNCPCCGFVSPAGTEGGESHG